MDVLAPLAMDDRQRCQHQLFRFFLKCGVAPVGVKQHNFGATAFVCVCGCCIIGKPKTITRNTYDEEISDKVIIGWLGWHRLVLSTTLLELLYSGCVGVGPVNYQTKALFGTHMANKLPKQIVIEGVGWRRLVASNRSNGNFTNGGDSAGSGGWC